MSRKTSARSSASASRATGASRPLKLGDAPLTLEQVQQVAVGGRPVEIGAAARARVAKAHAFLKSEIARGETLYGVNTGFGLLSNVRIPDADIAQLQLNLLRSHACGVGAALPDEMSRALLLLRAQTLCLGHSGVRVAVIEQILSLLNHGIHPVIPEQGSVGASGDLAPLAHLALVLIGEGRARVSTSGGVHELSGEGALAMAGLRPLVLGPKEGLALINGTQFMTAIGALALLEAEHLAELADVAGAMSLEAMKGTEAAFEPEIQAVRPHPGQIETARRLRAILLSTRSKKAAKSGIARSHEGCGKVQDPYSLRCMPQVHGASRDVFTFVRQVLEREINAVTDNPLVFPADASLKSLATLGKGLAPRGGRILSGGNFHGQIVAMAMDFLAIAVAELASISEERLAKLVNPAISELPAFLTPKSGLNSGFMMVQVSAASIVSENKTLCHPASVDSIPTSADKEDHVSMGAWAARKAARVVTNTRRVLAMELLAAAQGIEFSRPLQSSAILEDVHALIRSRVPKLEADRAFAPDIAEVEQLIESQEFASIVARLA